MVLIDVSSYILFSKEYTNFLEGIDPLFLLIYHTINSMLIVFSLFFLVSYKIIKGIKKGNLYYTDYFFDLILIYFSLNYATITIIDNKVTIIN